MYIKRTKDEIMLNAVARLTEYADNKFNLGSTSTVRIMLETIASELARTSEVASLSIMDKTLYKAAGAELDTFGILFNITRLQASTAYDNTNNTIKFYLDSGMKLQAWSLVSRIPVTIVSSYVLRNGVNSSFIIKAGTVLYSTTPGVTFRLDEDVAMMGTDTYAYGSATALLSGSVSNIESGAIISHNIAKNQPELADVAPYIFVTNIAPINNGRDIESDYDYRVRLRNALSSCASSNEIAIRMAALSVPGVAGVELIKYMNGLGTTGVKVTSQEPIANLGLLRAVRDACSRVISIGEVIDVVQPEYTAFKCKVDVVGLSTLSQSELDAIKLAIASYVLNIPEGGTIIKNQIIQIAMTNNKVKDVSISYMQVGDFDPISGSVLSLYSVVPSNISAAASEKWYTDTTLIEVCNV